MLLLGGSLLDLIKFFFFNCFHVFHIFFLTSSNSFIRHLKYLFMHIAVALYIRLKFRLEHAPLQP